MPARSSRAGSKDLDLGSLSLAIASIPIRDAEAAWLLQILATAIIRYWEVLAIAYFRSK